MEFKYKLSFVYFSVCFYEKVRELNMVLKCKFYASGPSIAAYVINFLEKTDQPGYGLQNNQCLSHKILQAS